MEEKDTYLEQTMMLNEISKINKSNSNSSEGTQNNIPIPTSPKFKPIFKDYSSN